MTELFVLLVGVVGFGGSLFWRRRRVDRTPVVANVESPSALTADEGSGDSTPAGTPGDVDDFAELSEALRSPRARVSAPVEPPDPVVVAVCAAVTGEVVSVRLRTASGTKVLY